MLLGSLIGLRQHYGEREARRVLGAVEQLRLVRDQHGIASRLLLTEAGLDDLGIAAVANEAAAIAAQLAAVARALEQRGDQIESVLIIGGHAIIPFDLAANPTSHDGDAVVPSDLLYGGRDSAALMPEWPVGRLPGAEGTQRSAGLLIQFIQNASRLHTSALHSTKTFGYSTAVWRTAAAQVYAELSTTPLLASPPTVAATLDRALLDGANAVYCNLHGVRGGAAWYGQAVNGSSYLIALRPIDVLAANLTGALVLSEACYSAVVAGRDEHSSLALAFLARGCAAFIGATAVAYGPAFAPLGEADLIALHFWRAVRQGNTTVGAAFLEARAKMLIETLARQPALDADDRKTMLEFVLYGDPTLQVGQQPDAGAM